MKELTHLGTLALPETISPDHISTIAPALVFDRDVINTTTLLRHFRPRPDYPLLFNDDNHKLLRAAFGSPNSKRRKRGYQYLKIAPFFRLTIHKPLNSLVRYLGQQPASPLPAFVGQVNDFLLQYCDQNTAHRTLLRLLAESDPTLVAYVCSGQQSFLRSLRGLQGTTRYLFRCVESSRYFTDVSWFGEGDCRTVFNYFAANYPYLTFSVKELVANFRTARYDEHGDYEDINVRLALYDEYGETVNTEMRRRKLLALIT